MAVCATLQPITPITTAVGSRIYYQLFLLLLSTTVFYSCIVVTTFVVVDNNNSVSAMSVSNTNNINYYDRSVLPSRPIPWIQSSRKEEENKAKDAVESSKEDYNNDETKEKKFSLEADRLIGMTRVGSSVVSPNGKSVVFHVQEYDFNVKKFNQQLWYMDLERATTKNNNLADDSDLIQNHGHLRKLSEGKDHGWSTLSSPQFSPCGRRLAFLSDRSVGGDDGEKKTRVWMMPLDGPGEANLLADLPLSVSDLEWTDHGGLMVAASVYVDQKSIDDNDKEEDAVGKHYCSMKSTADRDKALNDNDELGGRNAILYSKLPIRQWDRWLDAKMAHPFYLPLDYNGDGIGQDLYSCDTSRVQDLIPGVPTAVPSGAFGGSEDWSVSKQGHVAVSARPPLAEDEAWTSNRHIYLKDQCLEKEDNNNPLGICLTKDNPGYDFNPTFSPDGTRLAWLSMSGPTYEADAVGIKVYNLKTQVTTTLLEAEKDWDYSPASLKWSHDGHRLYFVSDVKSRMVLCSIDAVKGVDKGSGNDVTVHTYESSLSLHGEVGIAPSDEDNGQPEKRQFLTSVQSLTMPSELFLTTTSTNDTEDQPATLQQLTYFNTDKISKTALGRPGELIYKGANGEDVQAWFISPAGLSLQEELQNEENVNTIKKKWPLVVMYHGGPQGSTGDDWHYRWNLQYYASMGFAVLAPNFHGSSGFGHSFCREISRNWQVGGSDVINGVHAALKRYPWLDSNRVVGLGGSYGGYTSTWLNGNAPKDMFKAFVCHCGIFDMRSFYYTTEELFFPEEEFGSPPYTEEGLQNDSSYQKFTPSANVQKWATPTLVIHGAKDFRVVESEGISIFTALQRRGIPSQLLYFPTENHWCLNPQNSMVWHETVLCWIKKWTS